MKRLTFFYPMLLLCALFTACEGDLADTSLTPAMQAESSVDIGSVAEFTRPDRNGSVIFWKSAEDKTGVIQIVIGKETRTITANWLDKAGPDCKVYSGCALFSLPAGTYRYSTLNPESKELNTVGSVFTVRPGECLKIRIVPSGAEPKLPDREKTNVG